MTRLDYHASKLVLEPKHLNFPTQIKFTQSHSIRANFVGFQTFTTFIHEHLRTELALFPGDSNYHTWPNHGILAVGK